MSTKVKIVGAKENVVSTDHFSIDECIGNVATKCDDLSMAIVTITEPTSEPWITIDYDEYMYVTDGFIEIYLEDGSMTKVVAGQTVFIEKGTRMQVVFPSGNTKYIPVCLPAFKPERCLREEGTESDVSKRLNALHNSNDSNKLSAEEVNAKFDHVTKVYHMCEKKLWDEAVSSGTAYFPTTFHEDGKFTHATAVADRLISTANHFYTSSEGDWICIELDRNELLKLGILTIFEEAKPVGTTDTNSDWETWVFPHIFGGIPTHVSGVVTNVLPITRDDDGSFLSIEGL
ncbi:hypothetical protein QTG54_013769 [Skeletonema marinoi]|uniref:Uncharacterized protein n=1 Tax=Skeletonema marinoi TaxID=267567 RepID=A0AAD8XXB4_9STRA|nr:hypothetical protein QTG54_013769 [Skeletonema marinoi]